LVERGKGRERREEGREGRERERERFIYIFETDILLI